MIKESDSSVDIDGLGGCCLRGMAGLCAVRDLRALHLRVWQCAAIKAYGDLWTISSASGLQVPGLLSRLCLC
jgi:hypothetical protein